LIRAVCAGAALAAPAVYAALAADRAGALLGALGGLGVALLVLGAALRLAEALPLGIALVGAEYGLFIALGDETVRLGVPLVAGALIAAAELGYSAVEPPLVRAPLGIKLRRAARLLALVAGGVAVSALVLAAAVADVGGSAGVQLIGLAAAVAAVGLLAVLARAGA
jgi:hypothetical protein